MRVPGLIRFLHDDSFTMSINGRERAPDFVTSLICYSGGALDRGSQVYVGP